MHKGSDCLQEKAKKLNCTSSYIKRGGDILLNINIFYSVQKLKKKNLRVEHHT